MAYHPLLKVYIPALYPRCFTFFKNPTALDFVRNDPTIIQYLVSKSPDCNPWNFSGLKSGPAFFTIESIAAIESKRARESRSLSNLTNSRESRRAFSTRRISALISSISELVGRPANIRKKSHPVTITRVIPNNKKPIFLIAIQ